MKKIITIFLLTFSLYANHVFVGCEGNFYQSNGSVWLLDEETSYEYLDDSLGATVQALHVYNDKLFVTVNGSHKLEIFDINELGIEHFLTIDTNGSSPREMITYGNSLYFSNWYSADVKVLNLSTFEIEDEIAMPGLPEDIVLLDGSLYVSITMNYDWSDGSEVVSINPNTNTIIDTYDVGVGPGNMLVHNGEIYISRTYYDENWNAFYGTSKIDSNNEVVLADYGAGVACGGSVHTYQNEVYRVYNGGIARLDENLEIVPETRIGDFNQSDVYSVEVIGDNIYFGLSDFAHPDQVVVLNSNGDVVQEYSVGVAPGDFAVWEPCVANGDVNEDANLNIFDIVMAVSLIVNNSSYNCKVDLNSDGDMNVVDVVAMVQQIFNIDSFSGAVNWLNRHFPSLNVMGRLKAPYITK